MHQSVVMLFTVTCFLGLSSDLCQADSKMGLSLAAQTYRSDREFNVWKWNEDWDYKDEKGMIIQFMPKFFKPGSLYEAYLINSGDAGLELGEIHINGKPIDSLITPGSQVVWYQLTPQSLLGGQMAQLLIRFREEPARPVEVAVNIKGASPFRWTWKKKDFRETGTISRIALSHEMQTLYVHMECGKQPFRLDKVALNGLDVTGGCNVLPVYGGYAALIIPLPGRLENGTEHTLIVTHGGLTTATCFRAIPTDFHFAIFEGPDSDNMKMHHFDVTWHHRRPSISEIHARWSAGIQVIAPYYEVSEQIRNVPGILAHYLPDEPDVADYIRHRDINPPWKRLGLEAPGVLQLARDQRRADQSTPNVLICDSTFKPANYFTYGRIGDLFVMDKYSISHGDQPMEVYATTKVAALACRPLPLWVLLGCYRDPQGGWNRHATGQEMRLMALGSVAGGTQTLGYWIYSIGKRFKGAAADPGLWHAMGQINGEIKLIGNLLSRGQPVSPTVVEAPKSVIPSVIRSGDDRATVLVLLNPDHYSDAAGLHLKPVRDFNVTWTLPKATTVHSFWKLSFKGPVEQKHTVQNGKIVFHVDQMAEGDMYVAIHDSGVIDQIQKLYRNDIEPQNRRSDAFYRGQTDVAPLTATQLGALPAALPVQPVQETGGNPGTDPLLAKPGADGPSPHRMAEEPMTIIWKIPDRPGRLALQYRSRDAATLTITDAKGRDTFLILPPSPSGSAVCRKPLGKGSETVKLELRNGTVGRTAYLLPVGLGADDRRNVKGTYRYREPKPGEETSSAPISFEKGLLTDGSPSGVTWTNKDNCLAETPPQVTVTLDTPRRLSAIAVTGVAPNQWYALSAIQLSITDEDNRSIDLDSYRGFEGKWGKGDRAYAFYWPIDGESIRATKSFTLTLTPHPFLRVHLGEIVLIPSI